MHIIKKNKQDKDSSNITLITSFRTQGFVFKESMLTLKSILRWQENIFMKLVHNRKFGFILWRDKKKTKTRMEFYGVKLEWILRWDWDEIWSLGHRGGKSINKCNQTTSKLFLEKRNDNSFWFTTGSLAISH